LRNTFCNVPEAALRRMVGGNAVGLYRLDIHALRTVARQIDAPTLAELRTPIDAVPDGASATAFRTGAGGWS
jgi:hypothetical protein